MTTRRPSKAEIRRQVAARKAAGALVAPLPPAVAAAVSAYVPRGIDAAVWEHVRAFVIDVLSRCTPAEDVRAARRQLDALAAYVAWAHQRGHPLLAERLLDVHLVEVFTHTGSLSRSVADRYRAQLSRIITTVQPAGAGAAASLRVSHRPVRPPYTRGEVAALVRIASTQPSEIVGRQLRACVGLGLGAGIDASDLKPMRIGDIHDDGTRGIRVQVPGQRQRVVWVLMAYEDLVRSAIRGQDLGHLVIGRRPDSGHAAAAVFRNAEILGDAPTFDQARMRTTWLATLLSANVPLPVLMRAAGLTSGRTLTDLAAMPDLTAS